MRRRITRRRRSSAAGRARSTITPRIARRARRSIRGWQEANDYLIGPNADRAIEELQKAQYKDVPLADFREQFKASKYFTSADWRKMYGDGTVTKWLQQVTDFFVKFGNIPNAVPAQPVLRSDAVHGTSRPDAKWGRWHPRVESRIAAQRPPLMSAPLWTTTTSSSAPDRPVAFSPTGCRRIRRAGCCCSKPAAGIAISGSGCRSATSARSTTRDSRGSSTPSRPKARPVATSSGRAGA